MKTAPAILQLRELYGGANIAANVCATSNSPYQHLFESLYKRCGQWRLYRRARSLALLSAVAAVAALGLMLMARISVRRYVDRQQRPGNLALIFILRGIPLLLAVKIAVSLLGFGVVLQDLTGKASYAAAILAAPFLLLFLVERRMVLAFVEPELFGGRTRGATRFAGRRAPPIASVRPAVDGAWSPVRDKIAGSRMRIAIVSDIHGNRTAFDAVLADLRDASPDLVLHGGDLADGGASPVEIVDHIRDLSWPGVLGNGEEALASPDTLEDFVATVLRAGGALDGGP